MHILDSSKFFRYRRLGFYYRQNDGRLVQRFLCLSCGHTFSQQSFSITYYLKRPELLRPVAAGLNAASANRQLARSLDCAPSTVTRLSARLGRHALLFQAWALEDFPFIVEPLVFDHFETFTYSQNDPLGLGTCVGSNSWFLYQLDTTPHRRGGRMSVHQKKKLARRKVASPTPGQYVESFKRTLDFLLTKSAAKQVIKIVHDGHKAYAIALNRHPLPQRFEINCYPNPKRGPKGAPRSKEALLRDLAMFPIDQLHSFTRHSSANHRRETIAFARRANSIMERLSLFQIWRNFIKRRSERRSFAPTPAMALGLTDHPWSWPSVLARRLFPSLIKLPDALMKVYRREIVTPALGYNAKHELKLAF